MLSIDLEKEVIDLKIRVQELEEKSDCGSEENSQCAKDKEINELQHKCRQLSNMIENQDIRIDKWLNYMQEQINKLKATKVLDANTEDDPYKIQPSGYSYATANEKTADEMFKELNYTAEDVSSNWVRYVRPSEDIDYHYEIIMIKKDGCYYYKVKENKEKRVGDGISEAEDVAIH